MLAAMSRLQEENGHIVIPMSDNANITVHGKPDMFESPVSYRGNKEVDDVGLDEYYEDSDDDLDASETEGEGSLDE